MGKFEETIKYINGWCDMPQRFQQGAIEDFILSEDVMNNSICVIDRSSGKVRKAANCNEYLTHQTVLVYDWQFGNEIMPAGRKSRCWHVHIMV